MKIDYKNHPILEKIHNKKLGIIPYFECDEGLFKPENKNVFMLFKENFEYYANDFNKEIIKISPAFADAGKEAMFKLTDLYTDIIKNDISDFSVNGTFIIKDRIYTISYNTKKGSDDNEMALYVFTRDSIPLLFYIDSDSRNIRQFGWFSKALAHTNNNDKDVLQNMIGQNIIRLITLDMFRKYANVETKILQPNIKIKDGKDKYLNETKLNITYMDSKWFTTLVQSNSFKVKGHFRLQPKKKDNQWTKELIWISDFKKDGYTSKAKILNNV